MKKTVYFNLMAERPIVSERYLQAVDTEWSKGAVAQNGEKVRSAAFKQGKLKTRQQEKMGEIRGMGLGEGVIPHTLTEAREAYEADVEQLSFRILDMERQVKNVGLGAETRLRLQQEIRNLQQMRAGVEKNISVIKEVEEENKRKRDNVRRKHEVRVKKYA